MSAWPSALASKLGDLYPQPTTSLRASSIQSTDTLTVALSNLQSWAAKILDRASDLVRPSPQPTAFNDKVLDLLTTYSTASVSSIALLLLSLIFLGYRYLMTDRHSFGWAGGRGSPFLGGWADPARNLSGHFEYIDPDDELYTRHRPSAAHHDYAAVDDNDPGTPDRIHVRYLANQFAVDFPAYWINEERASVKELRRKVADRLGVDPRKVRLVYKKKELKRNQYSLREYRMKQNSEVSAIVTESPNNYDTGDRDSPNESGSDSGSGNNPTNPRRQQRPRSHSNVRLRSDENIPRLQTNGNGYLSPTGYVPSPPVDRRPRDALRPSDGMPSHRDSVRPPSRGPDYRDSARTQDRSDPRRERDPSRTRGASPGPPPAATLPPADPNTPLGKAQALASVFHTIWLPKCTKFIVSPPSDLETRKKEHLKLSESIMQYVVDKADAIDVDGNNDARMARKALVNETQAVLRRLDVVAK